VTAVFAVVLSLKALLNSDQIRSRPMHAAFPAAIGLMLKN
jgi:hypothetical protein